MSGAFFGGFVACIESILCRLRILDLAICDGDGFGIPNNFYVCVVCLIRGSPFMLPCLGPMLSPHLFPFAWSDVGLLNHVRQLLLRFTT